MSSGFKISPPFFKEGWLGSKVNEKENASFRDGIWGGCNNYFVAELDSGIKKSCGDAEV
jgi:hypothetical protein